MSIQRYTEEPFASFVENERGDFVKYSDHAAELHRLLSTLADIRAALGVGDRPMLSDLPKIVREVREQADRDEKAAVQLERGIQFWRTRCRELKDHLRKIEDMANESPNAGHDPWQMLADITNAVHDALNAKEPHQ